MKKCLKARKWWTLRDSNPGRYYPRRFSRPVRSTNSAKDPRLLCLKKGIIKLEVPPRFELGIAALQAAALPLGDGTSQTVSMVPEAGLEPAQYCYRGILSPLRLPISPPGHGCLSTIYNFKWSGKRGSNSRPQPWQGCALPLSYSRNLSQLIFISEPEL